jgi:hypothetical protein
VRETESDKTTVELRMRALLAGADEGHAFRARNGALAYDKLSGA